MSSHRNIDHLFQQLRQMPAEIPLEKVEQFVLAQAAVGIAAVSAPKGISLLSKAFFKSHLNTIIIMTSTITASLVSIMLWPANTHDSKATDANHNFKGNRATVTLPVDTPMTEKPMAEKKPVTEIKTVIVNTASNGKNSTTTTTTTITNTNTEPGYFKFTSSDDSLTKAFYKTYSDDSGYSYSYASGANGTASAYSSSAGSGSSSSSVSVTAGDDFTMVSVSDFSDGQDDVSYGGNGNEIMYAGNCKPNCKAVCCEYDSLTSKLEKQLLKDGLIADTLHYVFKINASHLTVNGAKQPKDQWEKYKKLIEANSEYKMTRGFYFSIQKDGESSSTQIEN